MENVIFNLKMKRAALKQMLREMADELSEDKINEILDELIEIDKLIEILEQTKGK